MSLLALFQKIALSGIREDDDFHEKRKVQNSNYMLLYMLVLNLVNLLVYTLYYWQIELIADAISSVFFALLGIYMHRKYSREIVRHVMVSGILLSLLNGCYLFGNQTGIHFYIIFLPIIPFLLFNQYRVIFTYTGLTVALFILYEIFFAHQPKIADPNLAFSYYPNLVFAFLMFLLLVFIFRHDSDSYQQLIEAQNKDLSALSFKLMLQKDEALISSNLLKQRTAQLERKNKSILDSLRLASMLQHETLPGDEEMMQGLKGGMLLYKPKDVVSGDFYWTRSSFSGKLVVVADCIGHGVPGGMMTIFASNLITQIVEEQGKAYPAEILTELDRRLRRRIKQDPTSELGDGMDIAICLINDGKISFSAASRPLIHLRTDGVCKVYSGNRLQVAGWKRTHPEFDTLEIDYQPGDRFFMFTDGACDQLNGTTGKRLSTRNLINEIQALQNLPFSKQKAELEAMFISWQGETSQTDDILVFGFEV
jgi:serine phosphatase RsbU (regulator of sigma subunit)